MTSELFTSELFTQARWLFEYDWSKAWKKTSFTSFTSLMCLQLKSSFVACDVVDKQFNVCSSCCLGALPFLFFFFNTKKSAWGSLFDRAFEYTRLIAQSFCSRFVRDTLSKRIPPVSLFFRFYWFPRREQVPCDTEKAPEKLGTCRNRAEGERENKSTKEITVRV